MNAIGVIPARYNSTRFEGKLLADLNGKSVIQHVYENAKKASLLDDLIIAADDERIVKAAKSFGAKVVLTSTGHLTGTDRLTEVVNPLEVRVVINIQGDEPFINAVMINDLVEPLLEDNKDFEITTLIKKTDDIKEINNPNVVKAISDKNGYALYFSRAPIPYLREKQDKGKIVYYKHIGIYGYTKDFLFRFKNLSKSNLENSEKLEQLRVLENGYKIKLIETNMETIGIDTPHDLEIARSMCGR